MPQDKAFETEEITKLLAKAKSTEGVLNFAFGLASKPGDCGLMLDRRRSGAVLKKALKGMPGIKKVCFGTLTLDGARVLLAAEVPLKGIVKQLKRRFQDEGLAKWKPVLVGPDGREIDEDSLPDADQFDDSDQGAEGAELVAAAPEAESPDPAALKARLVKLAQAVKTLGDAATKELGTQVTAAAKLLQAGALTEVEAALDEIKVGLAAALAARKEASAELAADQTATDPAALKSTLKGLLDQVKALPAGATQDALMGEVRRAAALLQSGNAAGAAAVLETLAQGVAAAGTTEVESDPQAIWRAAKEQVDTGISQLQARLKGYKDPVMDRIAEFGLNGITEGQQTALNAALFDFNKASGAARIAAAQALDKQAESYRSFVASNRVMLLVEKNPFGVALPIRKELSAALDQIRSLAQAAARGAP